MTGYDGLALRHLGIKVPYWLTALASFASYAVSFTLGFPLVTGGAVRYWLYAPAGLTAAKVASLTVVAGVTFWLGMGAIVGVGFISASDAVAEINHFNPLANRLIGLSVIAALVLYLVWVGSMRWRRSAVVGDFKLPGPLVTLGQMALGVGGRMLGLGRALCSVAERHGHRLSDIRHALFLRRDARHRQPLSGRPRRVRSDDPARRSGFGRRLARLAAAVSRHLLCRAVRLRDGAPRRGGGGAALALDP